MKKEKKTLKDLKNEEVKAPETQIKKQPKEVAPLPNYVNTKQIFTVEAKAILTDKEKNEAGQELAHKQKQLDQIRMERKQRMAAFKDQEQEVLSHISDLSNKVTLGYEYRKFRAVRHLDFLNKTRIYREVDTDRIVDTSTIQPDDYQMRLSV